MEGLRAIVKPEKFQATEDKINSFKAGYGTVVFFEENAIVEDLQERFPTYSHNFPLWSQQTSGMHQYNLWTLFELEGLGMSNQHYTEIIEEDFRKEWKIPESWKFISQMPFGKPTKVPGEKEFEPVEERYRVYR